MGGSMKTWGKAFPAALTAIREQSGDREIPGYSILAASA